jgi:hypothetical protein
MSENSGLTRFGTMPTGKYQRFGASRTIISVKSVRAGYAAQTMKQEMIALFGREICWKWRFGILLGSENNTKTDIKKTCYYYG